MATPDAGAFTCPRCSARFTLRTALCADWDDPRRNFGCPACGTFFLRHRRPRQRIEHLAQAHYLAAIAFALAWLIAHPRPGLHWLVLPAWVAFAIWLAFRLDETLPPRTVLEPIDDRPLSWH
jgi:hypothetical protein